MIYEITSALDTAEMEAMARRMQELQDLLKSSSKTTKQENSVRKATLLEKKVSDADGTSGHLKNKTSKATEKKTELKNQDHRLKEKKNLKHQMSSSRDNKRFNKKSETSSISRQISASPSARTSTEKTIAPGTKQNTRIKKG